MSTIDAHLSTSKKHQMCVYIKLHTYWLQMDINAHAHKQKYLELVLHLLYKMQPVVVDVVLGERSHRFWSFPQRQVAIVRLTNHKVVQLLWRGVMILNLYR